MVTKYFFCPLHKNMLLRLLSTTITPDQMTHLFRLIIHHLFYQKKAWLKHNFQDDQRNEQAKDVEHQPEKPGVHQGGERRAGWLCHGQVNNILSDHKCAKQNYLIGLSAKAKTLLNFQSLTQFQVNHRYDKISSISHFNIHELNRMFGPTQVWCSSLNCCLLFASVATQCSGHYKSCLATTKVIQHSK